MSKIIVDFADGEWHASTLGHFIGLLVDAGQDPAVAFRVTFDGEHDEQGKFVRRIEVMLIPNGHVIDELDKIAVETIHKTLSELIVYGVVT